MVNSEFQVELMYTLQPKLLPRRSKQCASKLKILELSGNLYVQLYI
jgi:hypothetical protein